MKFVLAASFVFLSVRTETQAFSPIHRHQPKPTFPLHTAATQPEDVYNSLLNNLNSLSSIDRAPSALTTTTQERAQQSLIDALTSAADAANAAAAASAQLSSDLGSSVSSPLLSPEAITTAQTKLSVLQQNLVSSADLTTYSRAISEALDASIKASEHTLASTNILLNNLLHFDKVMAHSMELYQTQQHFHLIPAESWQVAQEKLTLLIHNLSHGSLTFEGIGRSEKEWLDNYLTASAGAGSGWSLQTYDKELFRGVFAEMDRKLDLLPQLLGQNGFGVSAEGSVDVSAVSSMIMYGTLALVVGYSQRQSGVESYKSEIRRKLESGGYDIDQLAKDVGLPEKAAVSINTQVERILDRSEPAIANAAASTSMKSLNLKEETLAEDPTVLEDPALAMGAMGDSANSPPDADPQQLIANTSMETAVKDTLEEKKEVEKILTSTAPIPKPPKEEPALSLMAAAIDVLSPMVNDEVKPERHPLSTIMASEQDAEKSNENIIIELEQTLPQTKKVNVVATKTQSSKPKPKSNPKPKVNLPPASPLARLLAEELGLELTSIGRGSGKNGKILIDDVRRFQARLEDAKRSITNVGSYFATVNA